MAMTHRHGSEPGHQEGVQAMRYGMLHGIDIPLLQHSRSDISPSEVVHLKPLLRGGGSLVRGRSVGGRGMYATGGLGCTGDDGEGGAGTVGHSAHLGGTHSCRRHFSLDVFLNG